MLTLKMIGVQAGEGSAAGVSGGVSPSLSDVPLFQAWGVSPSLSLLFLIVVTLYALHLVEWGLRDREAGVSRVWHWVPAPVRGIVYAGIMLALFYFMKGETYDFIYFQF